MFNLNKKNKISELLIILILFCIGVSFRLIPHLSNFTPIAAIALFGGVYLSKRIALILPIVTLFFSDIFIGLYEPKLMVFVYISFILSVLLGFWLKKNKKWQNIFWSSFLYSLIFFLITNFAVWIITLWYLKDFSELVQRYLISLPFLKNNLLGNLFYAVFIFGAYEIFTFLLKRKITSDRTSLGVVGFL